jgi:hypothetical protein
MRAKSKLTSVPENLFEPKPMARATRVTLFEREVRERLSGPAVEILLARAQVLAEGRRAQSPTAGDAFFGSVMLTVDLRVLGGDVREPCTPALAARVAELMAADARVLKRVRRLAEAEAARLGVKVAVHSADVRVRAEGVSVYIDVDVEESRPA